MSGVRFRIVIPARYASQRLPGKPLLPIAGKPMIEHVYRRVAGLGAQEVVVATDDARIAQAVEGFGGRVLLTSPDHPSGTDRLLEVATKLGYADDEIVVNVQGDEPLIPAEFVTAVAEGLAAQNVATLATIGAPFSHAADLFNPNIVKIVCDDAGLALYFSRAPIPWVRGTFQLDCAPTELPKDLPFLRHIGIYAYRVGTLRKLATSPQAALERAESLEQLRALALGIRILVCRTRLDPPHGVDTPEDLARVAALMVH